MDRLNVVFTGGGTGGHLYPAIAIAQALGDRANVTFVGTADRLEATIVPNAGYPLVTVKSGSAKRAYLNLIGVVQARHRDCDRRLRRLSGCAGGADVGKENRLARAKRTSGAHQSLARAAG
jgi:hypothetical protein